MKQELTKDLQELYDYVAGVGQFDFVGNGISTYPNGDDNNKSLYIRCCALEDSGWLVRRADADGSVFFYAPEDK